MYRLLAVQVHCTPDSYTVDKTTGNTAVGVLALTVPYRYGPPPQLQFSCYKYLVLVPGTSTCTELEMDGPRTTMLVHHYAW